MWRKQLPVVAIYIGALIASSTLFSRGALAGELPQWANPAETQAYENIAGRFARAPEVKPGKDTVEISFQGLRQDPEHGTCTIKASQDGHIVGITSNQAAFNNDEYRPWAGLHELQSVTLWHNGPFPPKSAEAEAFNGAGVAHIAKNPKLTAITLAGGALTDAGLAEIAQVKTLKSLRAWHVNTTDAGLESFRRHPALEEIALGPFWEQRHTGQTLEIVSTCPKLRSVKLMETWLTWDNGLKHLAGRADSLQTVDLTTAIVAEEDIDKLKAALPKVTVKWDHLQGAGAMLAGSPWHLSKAKKWIPEALLQKAVAAAPKSESKK